MVSPVIEEGQSTVEAVLEHLPRRWRPAIERMLAHWPGRVLWGTVAAFVRVELFDRAMAIAAQFFTSVFPTVIMLGALFGGGKRLLSDTIELPAQSRALLEDAFSQSDTAFGILGALIVLASATSLSRALTRAFAALWMLPRPKTKLSSAWRWLAVVIVFPIAIVLVPLVQRYAAELPPPTVWESAAGIVVDTALVVFVPWILLAGRVPPRQLLAGALLFALLMLFIRPASARWLPEALSASADRYGTFGVAFTYLAWLYVVSWCLLAASAVGQVVTTDPNLLGRLLRGDKGGPAGPPGHGSPPSESPGPGEAHSATAPEAGDQASPTRPRAEEPLP